jgi:hypothetical protein
MKDTKNLTIAILGISALVLLALVIGTKLEQPAQAGSGYSYNTKDWIMVTGQASKNTDFLYIINVGQRKMKVYFPDKQGGSKVPKMSIVDSIDLNRAFAQIPG